MAESIGLIGGTGPEGKGLAARFALAGHPVIIGSRSTERGAEAAAEITALVPGTSVRGADNATAAREADVIILTVPYSGIGETLAPLAEALAGKIVISAVVPLQFSRARVALLPVPDGSAAEEAQKLLPLSRLAGAFHNLSAQHLLDVSHAIEGDVVVCSGDQEALAAALQLAAEIKGVRGVNGGVLANCRYVEAMTALLININRTYKAETQFKIIGI